MLRLRVVPSFVLRPRPALAPDRHPVAHTRRAGAHGLRGGEELIADEHERRIRVVQDVRDRKQSPLRPEVALEPAKIAYAAEMSIAEHRTVTAKDFA